jgi:hypothetical protein
VLVVVEVAFAVVLASNTLVVAVLFPGIFALLPYVLHNFRKLFTESLCSIVFVHRLHTLFVHIHNTSNHHCFDLSSTHVASGMHVLMLFRSTCCAVAAVVLLVTCNYILTACMWAHIYALSIAYATTSKLNAQSATVKTMRK